DSETRYDPCARRSPWQDKRLACQHLVRGTHRTDRRDACPTLLSELDTAQKQPARQRVDHVAGRGDGTRVRIVPERTESALAAVLHRVGRPRAGVAAVSDHRLLDDVVRTIRLAG